MFFAEVGSFLIDLFLSAKKLCIFLLKGFGCWVWIIQVVCLFLVGFVMERDFLGLSSKEPVVVVKEEINNDGCKDPGFTRGAGANWPFLNKISALPHFMPFKAAQDDKTENMTSGFMPISTTSEAQYFGQDMQGGTLFGPTAYPMQHDVHSTHPPHDGKMISLTNQGVSVPMGNPYFKNHFATTGQNFSANTIKQQVYGGIPVTAPHLNLPIAGITETWSRVNRLKTSAAPSQLTIFYAGTVNVYDDISPEQAQAMMLLAGNGSSISCNSSQPKAQAPSAKLAAEAGAPMNQPTSTPPSALSSPLSVSSHTGAQSVSGSTSTDELIAARTAGLPTTPVSKMEPPKIVNAVGSVAPTAMVPSAVPQARKVSLARFLEKRKERVMNSAPYNFATKSPEYSTPQSNAV